MDRDLTEAELLARVRALGAVEDVEAIDRLLASQAAPPTPAVRAAFADACERAASEILEALVCRKIPPRGAADAALDILERRRAADPGTSDACDALGAEVLLAEAFETREAATADRALALLDALAARGAGDARDRLALGQAIYLTRLLRGDRSPAGAAGAVARFRESFLLEPGAWALGCWLTVLRDLHDAGDFGAYREEHLARRPEDALFWGEACLREFDDPGSSRAWGERMLAEAEHVLEPLEPSERWSAARAVELGHLFDRLGERRLRAGHFRKAFDFHDHARRQGDPDGFRTIYSANALRAQARLEPSPELLRRAVDLFRGRRDGVSSYSHRLDALWDLFEACPEERGLLAEIEEVARLAEEAGGGYSVFPFQSLARLRLAEGNPDAAIEELKRGASKLRSPSTSESWLDHEGLEALRSHPRRGELD